MSRKFKVALFLVVLAWYFNDPVPTGFSDPWTLRRQNALTKVVFSLSWCIDAVGIYSYIDSVRLFMSTPKVDIPHSLLVEDTTFDGVAVRMYSRKSKTDEENMAPGLVYYHGGGWFLLSARSYDHIMISLAEEMDIVIASVEYRLSPEVKFPVAFEQCTKATKHLLSNANKYGVDPARVAIGGDSAGGNLAAAVALKLRDDCFSPMPKRQLLIYPVLQGVDLSLPSYLQNSHGGNINQRNMAHALSTYITGTGQYTYDISRNKHTTPEVKKMIYNQFISHEDIELEYHYKPYRKPNLNHGDAEVWNDLKDVLMNPYLFPLLAEDLKGVPDAYVYTAHYDVLRDEGLLYVKRLRKAGVSVSHVHGTKSIHGICSMPQYKEGQECLSDLFGDIMAHL